jgi:hypothetical protein
VSDGLDPVRNTQFGLPNSVQGRPYPSRAADDYFPARPGIPTSRFRAGSTEVATVVQDSDLIESVKDQPRSEATRRSANRSPRSRPSGRLDAMPPLVDEPPPLDWAWEERTSGAAMTAAADDRSTP